MIKRRVWRYSAAVAVVALAASGCGGGIVTSVKHMTTAHAVGEAFGAVGHERDVSLTVSVPLTSAQWQALGHLGGSSPISARDASILARSSLTVSLAAPRGGSLLGHHPGGDATDISVEVGSARPIELRWVNHAIYARLDLRQLGQTIKGNPAAFAHVSAGLSAVPVAGLGHLAAGQWVTVSSAELHHLSHLMAAQSRLAISKSRAAQIGTKLVGELRTAFKQHTTFANAGDHHGRTEYLATVSDRAFVQAFLAGAGAQMARIPDAGRLIHAAAAKTDAIPAATKTVVQIWVKHNRVDELDLNLAQFAPAKDRPPFVVPLRVTIAAAGPITAPGQAYPLDLSGLMRGLQAPGSSSSGYGSAWGIGSNSSSGSGSSSSPLSSSSSSNGG